MTSRILAAASAFTLMSLARAAQPAPDAGGTIDAVVSIPPLHGLTETLVSALPPERVGTVQVLIPPGVSEHGYEIPHQKLRALAEAELVVIVGLGMEPQVEKFLAAHPKAGRRVVRFADVAGLDAEDGHEHHHHHECDHDHGADPHVWLDPVMVEKLVPAIADGVRALAAAGGEDEQAAKKITEAEAALLERVRGVDAAYRGALEKASEPRTIVVAHDAWGWLARRYDLETVPIAGLSATEPTPKAVREAIRTVRESGAKAVFVEPQLSQQAARRVAQAAGATVRTLDPLGDGDWFAMMEANLAELRAALAPEPAEPRRE